MKVFDVVDFKEWQEIAGKCEYATFFHTPSWAKVFSESYPNMEIATKKFIFDDSTRVILPLIKRNAMKGFASCYVSSIAGVYGGVISDGKINEKKISEIFTYLIKWNTLDVSIIGNPFFDYSLPKRFKVKEELTQVLEIGKPEEEIWVGYAHSVKNQINKASKSGVMCREAKTLDEWKEYYSIYQESVKRWGDKATSNYPFLLFENLFRENNSNIKLWLVVCDNKIVGGNLNFYHNNHCVEWHASFLSDYFKYGIRKFLAHKIILDANAKGYNYYDFNPSGGHVGTMEFKETFGSKKLSFKRWEWKNSSLDMIVRVKNKLSKS